VVKGFERKSFKFTNFYFKRFKRIIPSLVTSSIFTIVVGYFNLSLEHFYELFRGLKYSLLFVGNIFFSQIVDYFSIDSERNLIVNLWSLSVEEQFYIAFPFLVLIGFKIKKVKIFHFFLICFFISFISYSEIFYNKLNLTSIFFGFEKYIFYSPFARTSQFLLGSLAATIKLKKSIRNKVLNYFLVFLLFLVLFSEVNVYNQIIVSVLGFFLLLDETPFSQNSVTNSLVHVGNISYSLYLFHQPILAGIRNHNFYVTKDSFKYINLESGSVIFFIILSIYVISLLNYKYVEETYRNPNNFVINKFKFVLTGFFVMILISLSPNLISTLYFQNSLQMGDIKSEFNIKPGTNYLRNSDNELCIDQDVISNACKFGKGEKKIYILGDSTISSVVSSFLKVDLLNKFEIIEYTQAGCYPIINNCDFKLGSQYFNDINSIENSIIITGGNIDPKLMNEEDFIETIKMFTSRKNKVILIGYIPSPQFDEAMYFKKNGSYLKSQNKKHYIDQNLKNEAFNEALSSTGVLNHENLIYIETFNIFCKKEQCNYFEGGNFLYIDGSHLSFLGSKLLFKESNLNEILKNS